jgi:hypothetical protein
MTGGAAAHKRLVSGDFLTGRAPRALWPDPGVWRSAFMLGRMKGQPTTGINSQ